MDQSASFAFGIVIGIVMIWMGVIIALASRAVLKGELTSRDNYRPFNPKFVKKLTEKEADAVNRRFSKYLLGWAFLMMIGGVVAMILGASGLGDYALLDFVIVIIPIFVIVVLAYYAAYKIAKEEEKADVDPAR